MSDKPRAFVRAADGTETDITEGVQALYDLVISSMNWGSGFWSYEDALPVAVIGRTLGFERIEEVERYVAGQKHSAEQGEFLRKRVDAQGWNPPAHDHVFSTVGKCMWGGCNVLAASLP